MTIIAVFVFVTKDLGLWPSSYDWFNFFFCPQYTNEIFSTFEKSHIDVNFLLESKILIRVCNSIVMGFILIGLVHSLC